MKPLLFVYQLFIVAPAILGQPFGLNLANLFAPDGWSAESLGQLTEYLTLLGGVGLLLTVFGYRLFDQRNAAELQREKADPESGLDR